MYFPLATMLAALHCAPSDRCRIAPTAWGGRRALDQSVKGIGCARHLPHQGGENVSAPSLTRSLRASVTLSRASSVTAPRIVRSRSAVREERPSGRAAAAGSATCNRSAAAGPPGLVLPYVFGRFWRGGDRFV